MRLQERHNGSKPPAAAEPPRFDERRLERDTKQLLAAIERLSDDASAALREQVDHRPYRVLGLGFLGGYVLGGGLTVRLGSLVVAAACRAALASLVSRGPTIRGT